MDMILYSLTINTGLGVNGNPSPEVEPMSLSFVTSILLTTLATQVLSFFWTP
jgi:hypothetical protein